MMNVLGIQYMYILEELLFNIYQMLFTEQQPIYLFDVFELMILPLEDMKSHLNKERQTITKGH